MNLCDQLQRSEQLEQAPRAIWSQGKSFVLATIVHFGIFKNGLYHAALNLTRGAMEKSVFTAEYRVLLELLRETRKRAKVTQAELADRLGRGQSFVSKWERGELRIDVVQLRSICRALDTSLASFVAALEKRLDSATRRR